MALSGSQTTGFGVIGFGGRPLSISAKSVSDTAADTTGLEYNAQSVLFEFSARSVLFEFKARTDE